MAASVKIKGEPVNIAITSHLTVDGIDYTITVAATDVPAWRAPYIHRVVARAGQRAAAKFHTLVRLQ